jgi:hypothetical protein
MLWPDGTCSQLGLQGAVNTSILTALQAMVNASNSAPAAALLNNRISSLGSAAAGESSAASSQVCLQHQSQHHRSHRAVREHTNFAGNPLQPLLQDKLQEASCAVEPVIGPNVQALCCR